MRSRLSLFIVLALILMLSPCLLANAQADKNEALDEGDALFLRANTLLSQGQYKDALILFDKVVKMAPQYSQAYIGRGLALFALGESEEAVVVYDKALELTDEYTVYEYRGRAKSSYGDYAGALMDYTRALAVGSNDPNVLNSIAWLFATCPDSSFRNGSHAVEFALQAMHASQNKGPNCYALDTLAAAKAQNGEFETAVETQKYALSIVKKNNADHNTINDFAKRLELYEQHKPYIESTKF